MSEPVAFLNGAFVPLASAQVSVLDRGFLFGDGVYEVIPVYHGRLFRLEAHLERLRLSLDGVRIESPYDGAGWRGILESLVERNDLREAAVYLQVTRGAAPNRDHAFPQPAVPTVFAMCTARAPVPQAMLDDGVAAVTRDDIRWAYCHIKAITLLANVLLRQGAIDEGAYEAILVRDGLATEGAASNLFVVQDGELRTPPKGPALLPGITRDVILELAQHNRLPCREVDLPAESLAQAEEIWLTSSTREILPVTRLDGRPVGSGRPGPVWRRMMGWFQAYKAELARNAA